MDTNFVESIRQMEEKINNEIDDVISNNKHELIESDEVNQVVVATNTYGWTVDDCPIIDYEIIDDKIAVNISFHCSGDQDNNKPFSGNKIRGTATAIIDNNRNVNFEDITAEIEY